MENERNLSGSKGEWEVLGDIYYYAYKEAFGEVAFEGRRERQWFNPETMFAMAEKFQKTDIPIRPLPKGVIEGINKELKLPVGQLEYYTLCSGRPEKTQKTHADVYTGSDALIKYYSLDEQGRIKISYITLDLKMRNFTAQQLKNIGRVYDGMVKDEVDSRVTQSLKVADVVFPYPNDPDFGKNNNPLEFCFIKDYITIS